MLAGIDTSNWQGDYNVTATGAEFVIAKATEGVTFVDRCCDGILMQCRAAGIRAGFYHFAGNGDASAEAEFFVSQCRDYFEWAIPILDWESGQSEQWAKAFCRRVEELTGVCPVVYSWARNLGWVPVEKRWVCQYPSWISSPRLGFNPGEPPIDCAIWQYASDGKVTGINGSVDMNVCYTDIWGDKMPLTNDDANTVWAFNNYGIGNNSNAWVNLIDTNLRVQELQVSVAAMGEALKTLAETKGADPETIAKAVSDAVSAKLSAIKLNVSIEDREGE